MGLIINPAQQLSALHIANTLRGKFHPRALAGFTIIAPEDCLNQDVCILNAPDNVGTLTNPKTDFEMPPFLLQEAIAVKPKISGIPFSISGDGGKIVVRKSDGAAVGIVVGGMNDVSALCPAKFFQALVL